MGVRERRERERQARRDAVLDATRALIAECGFVGTTTKRIADRAELSEATLFWYFKSKDEIFASLLFEGIEFLHAGVEEIAIADLDVREKLERLWKFFAKVRLEHPEYFQMFAYLAQPQATAQVDAEVRGELSRRAGENFERITRLITDAMPGMNVRDARIVTDLLWGAFVGLAVLRDSRSNLGAKVHPTKDGLARTFEFLRDGIAKKNGGRS